MAASRGLRLSKVASRLATTEKTATRSKSGDRLYKRLSALNYVRGSIIGAIDAYTREGKTVRKDELDRCIQELRKYKKYPHALEIMDWMGSRKFNFKHRDYAIRLDLLAKVQGIAEAEKYLSDLPSTARGPSTYGSLLNCYCAEKMTDKVEALFSKMSEEKMIVNAQPYNTLMSLYLRSEMPEKVVVLREEMDKMNVEPDTFTYNMLVRTYSILKDVDGVERAAEEMERPENGKLCNWTTYSSLAIAYIGCGHHEKAKLALKKLEEKMEWNDREAYHFLISLYAQLSDLENTVRIWETLKAKLTTVTNRCYLVTLQALKNLGDIKGMKDCYEEWESTYTLFDIRIANTVISAYLRHDRLQEAESVLRNTLDKSPLSFFSTWDMFMNFFLENGDVTRALRMIDSSTAAAATNGEDENVGVEPEKMEEFVRNFNKEHDIDSIRLLYESMKQITSSARVPICKSLLKAYLSGCTPPE